MYKLLRIAVFVVPLGAGAAWAQGSGTSGSAGTPGGTMMPSPTDDTRTPLQQKAQQVDDATPALPGDATRATNIPNTAPSSDRAGLPESGDKKTRHRRAASGERAIPRRTDVEHGNKVDKVDKGDLGNKDELNSDK